MIKVCYVNRPGLGAITGGTTGGGQLHNLREAKELAKDKRFDVHMIVEGTPERQFKYEGITVTVMSKRGRLRDIPDTYSAFKRLDADIYLSRTSTRLQIFHEALSCRILGKKYIYAEIINPYFILQRPHTLIGKWLYQTGLKLAHAVIANGKTIKERLRRFTKRNVEVINVPLHLDASLKFKRKHILWVGRADALKRPELFIKLAQLFPKEKFVMIVTGEFALNAPQVTIIKDVPHEKMNAYYAAAKMLLHTSSTEGFPNVFLEAWKNKTPVISMSVNPDNVLTEFKTGLYSESFEQMAKDIELLLKNNKKWKELSENGYSYVKKNHDINKIIEQYKALFAPFRQWRSHGEGSIEVSRFKRIGKNVIFEDGVKVFTPETIEIGNNVYFGHYTQIKGHPAGALRIGNNCWIGPNCFIQSPGTIEIGNYTGIGANVTIITSQHDLKSPERIIINKPLLLEKTVLEENVDIGAGVVILPGVRIGRGSVVGAGSVVTKNVPPGTIVVGNPARILRKMK